MRILIVGHGVVGKNLEKELEVLHPDVIDKYKPEENNIEVPYGVRYDIAFICVDTPIRKEERVLCDTSEVKNAIMENEAEIYVIKSTVSPGTTEQLRVKTGKRIIFSPEYYGGTQHCNNFRFRLRSEKRAHRRSDQPRTIRSAWSTHSCRRFHWRQSKNGLDWSR